MKLQIRAKVNINVFQSVVFLAEIIDFKEEIGLTVTYDGSNY